MGSLFARFFVPLSRFVCLAWLNLLRNKRRTALTAIPVFMAVFFSVLVESINEGMFDQLFESDIAQYAGHVEVQANDYWIRRSISHAITDPGLIHACLDTMKQVQSYRNRLDMVVLAASGDQSTSCMLWGIDKDAGVKALQLDHDNAGVWIGKGLAHTLDLSRGDSIILIGQTFFGRRSAELYPVQQIGHSHFESLNRRLVLMPIDQVRIFGDLPKGVTSVQVQLAHRNQSDDFARLLKQYLDEETYDVLTWKEVFPDTYSASRVANLGITIFRIIMYVIVGFLLFGTLLMIHSERKKEFAMLYAIGMNGKKLLVTYVIEVMFVSLTGLLVSILLSYPVLLYLNANPIMLVGKAEEVFLYFNRIPAVHFSDNVDIVLRNAGNVLLIIALVTGLTLRMFVNFKHPKTTQG